jgi:hypothetical protein
LEFCRSSFEKFFDKETKDKAYETDEKRMMFQSKLFGNLQFIGELYRRKILSQNIIDSVFESLLVMDSTDDSKVNDLVVEGAINLMNKAGQQYE